MSGVATGVNEKSAVGKTVFLLKSEHLKKIAYTREPEKPYPATGVNEKGAVGKTVFFREKMIFPKL